MLLASHEVGERGTSKQPTTTSNDDVALRERKGLAHLHAETWASVERAGIVLVPDEGFRDQPGPFFPQGTVDFLAFLRDHAGASVEIAAEDAEYKEVALHFDILRLATLFVHEIAAPAAAALIANYLWKHLGGRVKHAEVRVSMLVHRQEGTKTETVRISYEGPATGVEGALKDAIASLPAPARPALPATPPAPPSVPKQLGSGTKRPKNKGKRKK
jgi:hypothetical protein